MEINRATVTGADPQRRLMPLLQAELVPQCEVWHAWQAGPVAMIAFDRFYARIESTLMTVVTVDFSGPGTYRIEVVTGGGSHGLLGLTWGAEGHSNNKVLAALQRVCETCGFTLHAEA